jgi:hypothetical protein
MDEQGIDWICGWCHWCSWRFWLKSWTILAKLGQTPAIYDPA